MGRMDNVQESEDEKSSASMCKVWQDRMELI